VAIKVIDTRYRSDPIYADRFLREARSVAAWHHPHIIQIYYANKQDALYYFVMELVDGYDLGN
jgi:eukaryotic-like serine/threonine-protein kinase